MFEKIENHIEIHRSLEYRSKNDEISQLIDVLHDVQHFFRVFIIRRIFERREIERIQILHKRVDQIDEKTRNQQSLNAQFEISFNHAVYEEKKLISRRSTTTTKINATSRISNYINSEVVELDLATFRSLHMNKASLQTKRRNVSRSKRFEKCNEQKQHAVIVSIYY